MELHNISGACHAIVLACCSAVAVGIVPIHSAGAQTADWPSNADTHPGQIVYSRDVPYGNATRRFDQGEANTVSTDPSALVSHSLLIGLAPLSDAEQASVSAPLNRALDTTGSALQTGLSALSSAQSTDRDFTRAEGGASSVGGIISNSLSVLPSALGVIGKVLGDGK